MAPFKGNLVGKDGEVLKTFAVPFGDCELSRPDSASVNERRGGGKSTAAIVVKLPLHLVGGISMSLTANVYANLDPDGKVRFRPSAPRGITLSESARDTFKAHINDAIMGWSGRQRAFTDAYNRLTMAKVDRKVDKAADLEWAPELVKEPASEPQNATT